MPATDQGGPGGEAEPRALLDRVSVVLVAPTHPGNVGATARAMMNLGLSDLRLVSTVADPLSEEAFARASRGHSLLERARHFDSLAAAVEGARRVVGTSARKRGERPWATARVLAPELAGAAAGGAEIALVFGQERSGLSNEELDVCTDVCHVPTAPELPSMNLASAVMLVAYEMRLAALELAGTLPAGAPPSRRAEQTAATAGEMEDLFAHFERTLLEARFLLPHTAPARMRFLRKILARARLTSEEARFMRGIAERMEFLAQQAGGGDRGGGDESA